MTTPRFKLFALVAATVFMGSAGLAAAASAADQPSVLRYCPPGSSVYTGFFGAWCTDSTQAGVQPIDCKAGTGQVAGTWNNAPISPPAICSQAPGTSGQNGEGN
jgi:hypothetical protein